MKRIRNNNLGIDQGIEVLFDDYDSGGEMWTGRGDRKIIHPVQFSTRYRTPPAVHLSLSMWDVSSQANHRVEINAANIRPSGFEIVFTTWEDTQIARIRANWLAIGELPHEDDWELY